MKNDKEKDNISEKNDILLYSEDLFNTNRKEVTNNEQDTSVDGRD